MELPGSDARLQQLKPVIAEQLGVDESKITSDAEFAKDLAAVRYQILEDDETVQDTKHFEMLRKIDFFTEFENIEIWEVLRVAVS